MSMSPGSLTQSPGGGGGGQTPQPYLPQFLLGDMNNSALNSPHLHGHPLSRQPTPQQSNFFLNHHQQQPYGSSMTSTSTGGSHPKFWHNPAVSGSGGGSMAVSSNSPPRSGSGSNFLLPHHHHYPSLLQAPGGGGNVARTYSTNAYDYGQMRGSGSGSDKLDNMSGYGVPGVTTSSNYSPSPLQATPSNQQQQSAPGAPPLNRLVDLMNVKPCALSPASISMTSMGGALESAMLSPYMPSNGPGAHQQMRLNSPPSPTQIDPFYTQANDSMQPLDDTWVTIFGHPPSATSYVLQEFATYGQIVRYVPPSQTEQGNWLHVKYQTRMQAQKALSKNGKVLGGQFMVGVMACIDRKIMFGQSASNLTTPGSLSSASLLMAAINNEENSEPTVAGGGNKPIGIGPGRAPGFAGSKLDRTQSLRANARPLSMINRTATHDDSSIDGATKLPKKNTNVISKAMEFMFGW